MTEGSFEETYAEISRDARNFIALARVTKARDMAEASRLILWLLALAEYDHGRAGEIAVDVTDDKAVFLLEIVRHQLDEAAGDNVISLARERDRR